MTEADGGEAELQRRWAESHWPTPFLSTDEGQRVRVIAPGRWNHGPGPDFVGTQILDGEGRARRGNVELHLDARAWLQHGHDGDAAYDGLLLHVVERRPGHAPPDDPRIPAATGLPAAVGCPPARLPRGLPRGLPSGLPSGLPLGLPCEDIVERAGAAAVDAQLLQIARRRFERKVRELQSIAVPEGPGDEGDRRCLIAAARALGQPHNAALTERAIRRATAAAVDWNTVEPAIRAGERDEWRRGRGALGTPDGWARIMQTLLRRWTEDASTPSAAFARLASVDAGRAVATLRINRQLGRGRALQLLADAVYPLTQAWTQWLELPAARYQRTDELRTRLSSSDRASDQGLRWRHPQSQALLELERVRCSQQACRICPLAALATH
ncbi:MAG: DUF2851 family protein [Chloroflexi bacterium]|nr:DUF2851 family protein [Chloroflexota bacterium]